MRSGKGGIIRRSVEVSEYRAAKSSPMEDENKLEFGM
jgi:hypothetical protein